MNRHRVLAASVAAVALLGACGDDDSAGDATADLTADPTEESVDMEMFDPTPLEEHLNKPLAEFETEAEALGAEVRVVEIDGEPQAVTMDLRTNRVNVAVEGPEQTVVEIVSVG